MKFSKNKLQKIIDEEVRAILLERDASADLAFDAGQEFAKVTARHGARRAGIGAAFSAAAGAAAAGALSLLFPDDVASSTISGANERQFGFKAIQDYIKNHHSEIKNPEALTYRIIAYQDVKNMKRFDFIRSLSRGERSNLIDKIKDMKDQENDFRIIKKLKNDFHNKMSQLEQKQADDSSKKAFLDYVNKVKEMLEKDFLLTAYDANNQAKQKQDAIPQLSVPRRGTRKAPYQPDPLLEYIRKERGKIS